MIGVRCKHCKYKCHKNCSKKAPQSCGLPDGLMDFFRKQVMLTSSPSPSVDNFMSPTETQPSCRPFLSHASLDMVDMPDSPNFVIRELSKEPSSTSELILLNFAFIVTIASSMHAVSNGSISFQVCQNLSLYSILYVRMCSLFNVIVSCWS